MHFGIISPPVPGHLHPFGALGRELIARGHRVSVLHMPDLESRVRAEELEFLPVGESEFPLGSLPRSLAALGRLSGWAALRFTVGEIRKTTAMLLREAPAAIRRNAVDALLVDQTEAGGCSIAEYTGIPFITVCNALMMNREPQVPPAFSGFRWSESRVARWRNRAAYAISDRVLRPVFRTVNEQRKRWNFVPHPQPGDTFSPLAQITQQPAAFDYPRRHLPAAFSYVGPLRRAKAESSSSFPWHKLDGRPLVYASLGTLQNGKEGVFRTFAEAAVGVRCHGSPVQLVITHGGGLDGRALSFPGDPLVVSYAPQVEVLRRACLTLTHAGLNTVLDSLSCGVPLVAVPITYEQPAIGRLVQWCGAGIALPLRGLSAERVRRAMQAALSDPKYRAGAGAVELSVRAAGGVARAADLIEQAVAVPSAVATARLSR